MLLSFDANVSSCSLAESPPHDLQITAYKINDGLLMRNVIQLFWLQILFCLCINETTLFSFLRSLLLEMADHFASRRYSLKNKLGDRMIRHLLNLVIAKYRDLSVSQ